MSDAWVLDVERAVRSFAQTHKFAYAKKERELSASFEIGCLHALTDFYEGDCTLVPRNLVDGCYRYLTTPSGNPKNFSYIEGTKGSETFEIRQQVRIQSFLDPDVAFTPDIVVLRSTAGISGRKDNDYANGKRNFFAVLSDHVIAAHECKSTNPFPELMVSFLGMLVAAHSWLKSPTDRSKVRKKGMHLAPSLFVGGVAAGMHARMVNAMESALPMNIILGMHQGTWKLVSRKVPRVRIDV